MANYRILEKLEDKLEKLEDKLTKYRFLTRAL